MRIPRDWRAAIAKAKAEARCRVCRRRVRLECAHVIGRKHDGTLSDGTIYVHADDVVPLCRDCHRAYDEKRLDLLPYLSLDEQARAALHVGLVSALRRTTGSREIFGAAPANDDGPP